jgi:integrase
LNSGVRDAEMQNTEYGDFNWEKCTLHIRPKVWRKFRLKGKSKKKSAKDRFVPIPAKLVWKIKDRMRERNAQPHDLVFPNGEGKPDGHFLRKLKAIAKKTGVEGAELHRFRKTYADTLHEEGVSVNTIRIRLGHESLDVTLAYLKGKDAESRAGTCQQQQPGVVRISFAIGEGITRCGCRPRSARPAPRGVPELLPTLHQAGRSTRQCC